MVPHSKTRTWAGRCLPTLLAVFKVVMAVILDPLVDSRKEAMRRQPYGMILPSCILALGGNGQHQDSITNSPMTLITQHYLPFPMQQRLTVVKDGRA